jgi:hypothetical protein
MPWMKYSIQNFEEDPENHGCKTIRGLNDLFQRIYTSVEFQNNVFNISKSIYIKDEFQLVSVTIV